MKILLIYYTGTYNTRYLTDRLEGRLLSHGHTVDRVEVNCDTEPVSLSGYDLLGIGYPIYGFNAPAPLERYLGKLSYPDGLRFFIYKNSGETFGMNNASSRIILRRLRRAGAHLHGEYHFVMPYNIHFRFEDDFVRELLDKDEKLMAVMVRNLERGKVVTIRSRPLYNLGAAFVAIQKVGGNVNSFLYRVDRELCTSCGLCVRECPEHNIKRTEDGKIVFGHRCDMCMRCSFFCPKDAIRIGFLEGWRVNGAYPLERLREAGPPEQPYITEESKGFFSCFPSYYRAVDEAYSDTFPDGEAEKENSYTSQKTVDCGA